MQEYKVILTWEAIYDVTDIADYIEALFGQFRADRFQDDIKKGNGKIRILWRSLSADTYFISQL